MPLNEKVNLWSEQLSHLLFFFTYSDIFNLTPYLQSGEIIMKPISKHMDLTDRIVIEVGRHWGHFVTIVPKRNFVPTRDMCIVTVSVAHTKILPSI